MNFFDESTGSLMEFVVENNKSALYCPKLNKHVALDTPGAVLYESLPADINILSVFSNIIKNSVHDKACPRIVEPCPKCKQNIVKYVVILLQQIYVCPKCENVWHY